jgi:hypothetical protein
VVGASRYRLHTNSVPFPFGHEVGRGESSEIGFFRGVRKHRRAKRRRIACGWLVGASFEPGEQVQIGRSKPRPQDFDLINGLVPDRCSGRLGQAGRNADAQAAGDKL